MKTSVILLTIGCLCLAAPARAQDRSDDYRVAIETFFGHVQQGDYAGAIDYIYADNPWILNQSDNVQNIKNQFTGLTNIVGQYIEHEKLLDEDLAGRVVRVDYIVLFERQPIRFEFQFYNPGGDWMTYAFSYQDDLGDWLDEKVRTGYFYDIEG